MSNKKKCPKCGSKKFLVTAHVAQDWIVDEDGEFVACQEECVEVVHKPDDDDIWHCKNCGYDAAGSEFCVKEDMQA